MGTVLWAAVPHNSSQTSQEWQIVIVFAWIIHMHAALCLALFISCVACVPNWALAAQWFYLSIFCDIYTCMYAAAARIGVKYIHVWHAVITIYKPFDITVNTLFIYMPSVSIPYLRCGLYAFISRVYICYNVYQTRQRWWWWQGGISRPSVCSLHAWYIPQFRDTTAVYITSCW
jgi:hypothetical protein